MVERDGIKCGAEDMAKWFTHMSHEHGIAPSAEMLLMMNATLEALQKERL